MLITPELAAQQHGYDSPDFLWSGKHKQFLVKKDGKYLVDAEGLDAFFYDKAQKEDYAFRMTALADYVIELEGEEFFYSKIDSSRRSNFKQYLKEGRLSHSYATTVDHLFSIDFTKLYEEGYAKTKKFVPLEERMPLTKSYIMSNYWGASKTSGEIAKELNVPEGWVIAEISRLGMQKKKHGIKRKSRKGYIPPPGWGNARQNQPHRKAVVQICPHTFNILAEYRSTAAVEEHGFNRENVRRAIKRMGVHKGFLWSHKGMEGALERFIDKAKLHKKLAALKVEKPTKEKLLELYKNPLTTNREIVEILHCHPNTVAQYAHKYGIKKREAPVNMDQVKKMYLEDNMTAPQIAKTLKVSPKTISTYLSRCKIHKRVKET